MPAVRPAHEPPIHDQPKAEAMSRSHPVTPKKDRDSKSFTIELPQKRERNPLGAFQERRQVMRDRRNRRPKDARREREHFE